MIKIGVYQADNLIDWEGNFNKAIKTINISLKRK